MWQISKSRRILHTVSFRSVIIMPMCQAIYCSNRRENCPGKSFFAIPNPQKERERCATWLRNLGTTKLNIRTYHYSRFRVVCEDHFEQSAFEEDRQAICLGYKPRRKTLKSNAVPTKFQHKDYGTHPRPTSTRREFQREHKEMLSKCQNLAMHDMNQELPDAHGFKSDYAFADLSCTDVPNPIQEVEICSSEVAEYIPKRKRMRKRSGRSTGALVDTGVQTDERTMISTTTSSSQTSPDLFEFGTQMPVNELTPKEVVFEDHMYCNPTKPTEKRETLSTKQPQHLSQFSEGERQSPVIPVDPSLPGSVPIAPETDSCMPMDSSSDSEEECRESDPTYQPEDESPSTDHDEDNELEEDYVNSKKYMVFEDKLLSLVYRLTCPTCSGPVMEVKQIPQGSLVKIQAFCMNSHTIINWSSQPVINRTAVGNLLLAAATLFSGLTHKRVEDFANYAGLQYICESTFYRYQKNILLPVINAEYSATIQAATENARSAVANGNKLIICGDGRCDSPGHNAKYGTYSMMNSSSNEIVATALVQVSQASSSNAMEKVGFLKCMGDLSNKELAVDVMTTDRHVGIRATLKKEFPNVTHQFDVWHLSKSVKKKLLEKSKRKGCEALAGWIQAISNHLWWAATNCDQDPDRLVEMWTSISHHVTDSHTWTHGDLFKKCAHDALAPEHRASVAWLEPGSPAHEALNSVVFDKTILKDIRQITMALHTGSLEQYHGLMLRYCPKRQAYDYTSMLGRTQMAVIDHNHNSEREQLRDKNGNKKYTAVYQKATKRWVLRARYAKKDFSFVNGMMKNVIALKLGNIQLAEPELPQLPKNIAPVPCPPMDEMVAKHKSRFPE